MRAFILLISAILICYSDLSACTIFNVSRDGRCLIGNNEDWRYTDSCVKFIPAGKNKYGRVYFGFGKKCRYVFGGINDQGLFFDIASLTKRNDIAFDLRKQTVDNEIYLKVLETCSSIDEAIGLLTRYNVNGLRRHHIMIVDRSGNSAILEWGRDSLSVVMKTKDYQVMTNFNNTNPGLAGWYPCNRYNLVEDKLGTLNTITVEDVRTILESVKNNDMRFPTVYSNIYDLENKQIYLFHNHNFEELFLIDIEEELGKGEHSYSIPSLFSHLRLESPVNKENVLIDSVELNWQGNADSYHLYVSTLPDFKTCKPVVISDKNFVKAENESNLGWLILILFPVLLMAVKKRKAYFLVLIVLFYSECKTHPSIIKIKENKSYSYVLTNLETNKVYYWKIKAVKDNFPTTTSIVKQFSTLLTQ